MQSRSEPKMWLFFKMKEARGFPTSNLELEWELCRIIRPIDAGIFDQNQRKVFNGEENIHNQIISGLNLE